MHSSIPSPGIDTNTKKQVARLFGALEFGEQMAQECAHRQAALIDNRSLSRFLRLQSRQERHHAKFFHHSILYIGELKTVCIPHSLKLFSRRLDNALYHDDLIETLIGQQIVLEIFGGSILSRLNTGLDNLGIGLSKLRNIILQQEQSHHAFGDKLLLNELILENTTLNRLQTLSAEYLFLVGQILDEMSDVFLCLDEDPKEYMNNIIISLPDWLKIKAP